MGGKQKTAYERVDEILQKIEGGAYGTGDAIDVDALIDDWQAAADDLDLL
jgi:anti-sigma28 factor (negative regulator of flagellin synthesis)